MVKKEIRTEYKKKRKQITSTQKLKLDDLLLIQFQTVALPFIQWLMSYWPIEENHEPNTHLFTDYMAFRNPALKILYPKSDFEKQEMEAIDVDAGADGDAG